LVGRYFGDCPIIQRYRMSQPPLLRLSVSACSLVRMIQTIDLWTETEMVMVLGVAVVVGGDAVRSFVTCIANIFSGYASCVLGIAVFLV
jgi:hypothetical protein